VGTIVVVDAGGRIAASADGGRTFANVSLPANVPVTGIAEIGNGRFVLVGPRGIALAERPRT
jgi:photosystem II stability/assembly factor-like uncharacterized protein